MIFTADKFGYYTVGNLKTYSKVEAIEWQACTGHFPVWNFNREVFDTVDWFSEPDVDLWTLYKHRAQQIRNSYDYCVLFYSGGSDSDNVLKAWIDADCKIDEIACIWNHDATRNADSFMCAEISRVAFPVVEKLKHQHEFEFRVLDISQLTLDFLAKNKFDYSYHSNHSLSPNNIVKGMFRETVPAYQQLIDSGKRVCFVWGFEKPQLGYDSTGVYAQFVDTMDNCVGPYSQRNYNNGWYDELFYWTPDLPEIVVKQAHTVQRFVETCDMTEFYSSKTGPYGYNSRLAQWITHDAIKQIIYPHWNPNTFCNGKSPTGAANYLVYSPRDEWLWTSSLAEKKIMLDIILQSTSKVGQYWKTDNMANSASLYKGHIQKHYIRKYT